MGMFDDILCDVPLPDGYEGKFQTKDFDCYLDKYAIRADGSLEVLRWAEDDERVWEPLAYHGLIRFYTYDRDGLAPMAPHDESRWHEYEAKFTDGKLVEITTVRPASAQATASQSPPKTTPESGSGGGLGL